MLHAAHRDDNDYVNQVMAALEQLCRATGREGDAATWKARLAAARSTSAPSSQPATSELQ
jgi:hypothetical protein